MQTIYVEGIDIDEKGIEWGLIGSHDLIRTELTKMFGEDATLKLMQLVRDGKEITFIDKYCQFIVIFTYIAAQVFLLQLGDFKNVDAALDYYSELAAYNWDSETLNNIVSLVQEISNNPATPRANLKNVL